MSLSDDLLSALMREPLVPLPAEFRCEPQERLLAEARAERDKHRQILRSGRNPIKVRQDEK